MGILIALWGLIWPIVVPFMKLSEYAAAHPDSMIAPLVQSMTEFFASLF